VNIAQTVQNSVEAMPPGQIFGYSELPDYAKSSSAVIKAVGRMVADERLTRMSKGKFYVPKKGMFGERKPSDNELIREALYKDGNLRGYITGLALYNQLGLTTQVPKTITVASNGARQEKAFGTINIKTITTRVPFKERDVSLLQYLDVLKNIKKILDSDVNLSLVMMSDYIAKLPATKQEKLVKLALDYYPPQVRALVGLIYSKLALSLPASLAASLNPTTTYKIGLDKALWPKARDWNIR
jgi:hypothetical protein